MKKLNLKKLASSKYVKVALVGLLVGGLLGGIYFMFFYNPVNHIVNVLEDKGYSVVVDDKMEDVTNGYDVVRIHVTNLNDDVTVMVFLDGNNVVGVGLYGEMNYNSNDSTIAEGVTPFWVVLHDMLDEQEFTYLNDKVLNYDNDIVSQSGSLSWKVDVYNWSYELMFCTNEFAQF